MANLKGTGAPNKTIQAGIGDIYTDENTGRKYKCTFALRLDDSQRFDTQWTELKGTKIGQKPEAKPEKNPVEKTDENKAEEVEQTAEKTEEPKPEQKPKKNYTNYSKPKNK